MLIDTHCHLDQFTDPAAVLDAAASAGVRKLVAVSESPDSMLATLALQRRWPGQVAAGLGLHPVWITQNEDALVHGAIEWIDDHLGQAALLAEAGLDRKWATTPQQQTRQRRFLDLQLQLAAAHHRPVALHSRRCPRQTMECAIRFRERHGLNVQLHWFTCSSKLIRICNVAGIYVSVGPTVILDPSTQAVVRTVADHLLLLETDAPVPIAGRQGRPADVRAVAAALADLKCSTLEAIAELTTANARRFLGGA